MLLYKRHLHKWSFIELSIWDRVSQLLKSPMLGSSNYVLTKTCRPSCYCPWQLCVFWYFFHFQETTVSLSGPVHFCIRLCLVPQNRYMQLWTLKWSNIICLQWVTLKLSSIVGLQFIQRALPVNHSAHIACLC